MVCLECLHVSVGFCVFISVFIATSVMDVISVLNTIP
jgi:hypothetical protein